MSPRSDRRDQWTAVGLALLALAYLGAGRRYPLDTLATPGPGVFPVATGLALLLLAIWQLLTARRPTTAEPSARVPTTPEVVPPAAPVVLVMSLVLALYAATLPVLGFMPTSAALVLAAARLMGLGGWRRPAVLAIGVTLGCRLVFGSWLGVPLP